ncbi:hypothetical protein ABEW19_01465 [Paenibacillus illinoisensis]|uniref:hypothetical protein n=1 Tax=Paenibacillus illinoisensis TaxID=59845 RepID=UPI003D2BAF49
MRRIIHTGACLLLMVCMVACSIFPNKGPNGEPRRTDDYTLNSERRDLNQQILKNPGSFRENSPNDYTLTASVNVSHENGADYITYEILVNEVRVPMDNVIQSFTLNSSMINNVNASELLNSNVHNTHETSLGPYKEPLGLSLSRGYTLKPEMEIDSNIIHVYEDMYIKISYGPNEDRTEDYFHLKAEPSSEAMDYLRAWSEDE